MFEHLASSFDWLPLADAAAKATILLAAAAGVSALLRKCSAASRHLVWTCALLAALALPLLSVALPRWQVPLVAVNGVSSLPPAEDPAEGVSAQMARGMDSRPASTEGSTTRTPAPSGAPALSAFQAISWPALLVSVWALGAMIILARLAVGILVVQWMARRTRKATDAPWLPLARQIAASVGVSRVTFRRSDLAAMPMAWGIFRPSVMLPAEADTWPENRLRIVLLHELAHVRRADCLTHILAQAACALYWMNPLAWLGARRLRIERERACDDLVLAYGTAGPDYADQLLQIARSAGSGALSATMAGASLAMARRSQLEGRLMSILDPSVPRTGVSRLRTAAAAAVVVMTLVPLAALQPWAEAEAAMVPQVPGNQPVAAAPAQPVDRLAQPGASVVTRTAAAASDDALQGAVQSVATAVADALGDARSQDPNPNPNPNPDPRVRGERSKANPKVVAALTEALKDADKEVRESAMQALVRLRDPGIFEPLVQALKDPSSDVRESAAHGLGQLRDKRAVAPLSGLLRDSAAGVREQVVFALGQLRDPAAVEGLTAALRDEAANVREQAAFALGQIRDERAVAPLVAALTDAAANVREQVVFALGQLRARAAVDGLIGALKDSDADVREQAAFALGQVGDPRAIDALSGALKDASASVRQQAAFALGQLAR